VQVVAMHPPGIRKISKTNMLISAPQNRVTPHRTAATYGLSCTTVVLNSSLSNTYVQARCFVRCYSRFVALKKAPFMQIYNTYTRCTYRSLYVYKGTYVRIYTRNGSRCIHYVHGLATGLTAILLTCFILWLVTRLPFIPSSLEDSPYSFFAPTLLVLPPLLPPPHTRTALVPHELTVFSDHSPRNRLLPLHSNTRAYNLPSPQIVWCSPKCFKLSSG
jgi:hypothetical protein